MYKLRKIHYYWLCGLNKIVVIEQGSGQVDTNLVILVEEDKKIVFKK